MSELCLVRARLRRDRPAAALAPLLLPQDDGARAGAAHRLIWSLFADSPDRRRDFLWRETNPGEFLALARRAPADPHDLFHLDWKPFAPSLHAGQRLGFNLRANPTVSAPAAKGQRGKRHDAVTRAIAALPHEPCADQRRAQRAATTEAAAAAWLARQGERSGFAPDPDRLTTEAEDWVTIPRAGKPISFLALTFEGVLTVHDPAAFLDRLCHGFGAAKAFGCGLMLIRPAPGAS